MLCLSAAIQAPIFLTIAQVAQQSNTPCFVVGGFVRDFLINRTTSKDIDIVVLGDGIYFAEQVSKKLSEKPKVTVFKTFGTAMIQYGNLQIEFVGARKESYRRDSRNPKVSRGTLQDDQKRRDFTINALAISLNETDWGQLIDPFNGLLDLKEKVLRTPVDPNITYSDDPLRMMRAIRFATQLDFTIETASLNAIKTQVSRLGIVSMERIVEELNKIILSEKPSKGLHLMFDCGLLHQILPEVTDLQGVEETDGQRHKDNFYHTLEVVDNISQKTENLWLRWAALLHDIGKAPTKKRHPKNGWSFHTHEYVGSKMISKIFKRLHLPLNQPLKYVEKLVLLSARPIALVGDDATDSGLRRLLFDASDALEDLICLCQADITTKNQAKKKRYQAYLQSVLERLRLVEQKDRLRNWQPPLSGEDIMSLLQIKPGPMVGRFKNAIKEAILEGVIANEKQQAIAFLQEQVHKENCALKLNEK